MKAPKTSQNLVVFLGTCVLFLIISTAAWATASPVIFYSDLTSGPNTGGQNNNGVFVTIWGNNFGSTQGSSTVTVGGGAVANYQTWTNTEICFQLGSLAASGKIVVTTSNGTSNGITFTVRSGNIYFVQPGASTNGTGAYSSPFSHLWYAYKIQKPGDTVYVLAGTIHDEENGYTGWHSVITTQNAGTQADPIAYVAYPNATVILQADGGTSTWTAGSSGGNDPVEYIFRDDGGSWTTISKFTMELTGTGANTEVDAGTDTGWRVVGNTLTANSYIYAQIDFAGPNVEVIGNTIYNSGAGMGQGNENHSIYLDGGSNPFEIGWNYLYGNQNSGWEISCFHQGQRNGSIHDNLIIAKSAGSVKGILLGDVDTGETQSTEWGSTYKVYNNIIINAGQASYGGAMQLVDGTGYIYNNTIYYSGTETKGIIQVPTSGVGPNGGNPVWYFADNIIVANNAGLYISDENGNAPNWSFFALLADNNYYGQGNGPTNDATAINANPQFITPGTTTSTNFQLQATSPDINAGYNTTTIVPEDYYGLVRSTSPSIGAYEYSGSITPSSPVVTITSPSSGSSYTAGSNVTITTTASENNGTISNISLYNGSGILLGSSSSSPYNYVYNGILAGGYSFYAVATDTNGFSTTSSTITVTATTPSVAPSITTEPVSMTVTAPATATFSVVAAGAPAPTYQWMQSVNGGAYGNISGATSASYTTAATTTANSGTQFKCVVTNASGSVTSNAATLTVNPAPVAPSITSQPVDTSVTAPATATFTVAATGTPAPTYQWMQSVNGGAYGNISGATNASYTTAATTTANSGTQFKCVVTNASGSATSNAATLTVKGLPVVSITSPSSGSSITAGSDVSITASASETNGTIANVAFYNGSTLLGSDSTSPYTYVMTNPAAGSYTLTAVATDANGVSTTSSAITITVAAQPAPSAAVVTITNPTNGSTYLVGSTVPVTVSASEANGTIRYMYLFTGSGVFLGSSYAGSSTGNFTYNVINLLPGTYSFYAWATDANGVLYVSSTNTITVATTLTAAPPSITSQPVSLTVTAPTAATFTVAATGKPVPTYQWMQSVNGGAYSNISGATSASYTTAATTTANSGTQFKCVVTNASGSVTSNVATLTVNPAPVAPSITSQPVGMSVTAPATATFSVAATGTPAPTYQWMQSVNGGAYTAISGATSTSYTTAATSTSNSGTTFECVVTNVAGSVTSSAAALTVKGLPVVSITSPSSGSSITAGSDVSITASASETNGTIANVAFYNGSTLLGSDSSSPYTYVMTNPAAGSYTLTAVATDANGVSTTSSAITITVAAQPTPSATGVTITNPTNGSTYTAGSTIPVTVTASETNGSIRYMYLFTGSGVFLGSSYAGSSSGSFTYNVSNMTPGTYSFYAWATDANGILLTSSTNTIIVK